MDNSKERKEKRELKVKKSHFCSRGENEVVEIFIQFNEISNDHRHPIR